MSEPDVGPFLHHLRPRDPDAAAFARLLLDDGWRIVECWGPQQMDVWALHVQRGELGVRFGIERGKSDGVRVGPKAGHPWNDSRPLLLVIEEWAAEHDRELGENPLLTHGRDAIDWLAAHTPGRQPEGS